MKAHIIPLRPTGDADEFIVIVAGHGRRIRISTLESLFAGGRWNALRERLSHGA